MAIYNGERICGGCAVASRFDHFAPGGFIASPVRTDAASPICAPGMSVLIAPLAAVLGGCDVLAHASLRQPWSCSQFVLGRQLAGERGRRHRGGAYRHQPIVLYQSVQR